MDPNEPQIPNLASILQTLSAYAPRGPKILAQPSDLEDGEYDPSQYDPTQSLRGDNQDFVPQSVSSRQSAPPVIGKLQPVATRPLPPPSASRITTWPKALTFTVQHIFSNPDKKQKIKHLIRNQHQNERQWWASREELIRKAQGRDKSRMQLDSVLASVGGLVATTSRLRGEADGDEVSKELAIFDRKLHRVCREMVDASMKQLRDLEVPFFCADISDKFERNDLEALRKKMLQLLEDYCGYQDEEG